MKFNKKERKNKENEDIVEKKKNEISEEDEQGKNN
jgi:hypothetical protein